jgi:hypothetical protein
MLSEEQIGELFAFCEKKYVRWYDVQVELVDKLANAIEDRMAKDPSLGFDTALRDVYEGYGIFGFSRIVSERMASVYQMQRRTYYGALKSHFRWPKIGLTILLAIILFIACKESGALWISISMTLLMIAALILSIHNGIEMSRLSKKKKLILASFTYQSSWVYLPLYLNGIVHDVFFRDNVEQALQPYQSILTSIFISFYAVAIITQYQLNLDVRKKIRVYYPELVTPSR